MDDNSEVDDLLELEHRYWQAMKDKDSETTGRLTSFPCIVAGAQGVARVESADQMARMLEGGSWTIESYEFGDVEARQLTDDTVLLAYKVREDLTVDGKPVSFEAADTSLWVREGGEWKCAIHTESIAGDPFGRDRRPA